MCDNTLVFFRFSATVTTRRLAKLTKTELSGWYLYLWPVEGTRKLSAEGTKIEAPEAPRGYGMGVPLPAGNGLGMGSAPSPELYLNLSHEMVYFGALYTLF